MAARILVVDRNEAFATMLREMLESDGGHQVEVAPIGSRALHFLRRSDYDLTIVDMDLDPADMSYQELVQAVRQVRPHMRMMLIPLMGEDLPAEARRLDIQGTLSKPFFADDLLPNIRDALARQVKPAAVAPPAPPSRPVASRSRPAPAEPAPSSAQATLADLARETRADAVLLLTLAAGTATVAAQVSTFDDGRLETLAKQSAKVLGAARAAAQVLGRPDEAFEHNMFENERLRLYIMTLSGTSALVIVTPATTPLGTIRHNLRRAARHLGY